MKKQLLGLLLLVLLLVPALAMADVSLDEKHFPDANFRSYLNATWNEDGDDKLSDAEIERITSIFCGGRNIQSLKGVEYFPNLTQLDASANPTLWFALLGVCGAALALMLHRRKTYNG